MQRLWGIYPKEMPSTINDPRFTAPGPDDFVLRYGTPTALFYLFVAIFLGGSLLGAAYFAHLGAAHGGDPALAVVSPVLVLLTVGLLFAFGKNFSRTRLEVRGDFVTYENLFGSRTLAVSEIRGFRHLSRGGMLLLASEGSGKKDLLVSDGLRERS